MLPIQLLVLLTALVAVLGFIDTPSPVQMPNAETKTTVTTTTTTTTITNQTVFLPLNDDDDDGDAIIEDANSFFVNRVRNAVDAALPLPAEEASSTDDYPTVNIRSWLHPERYSRAERDSVVQKVLEYASANGSFDVIGLDIPQDVFPRLEEQGRAFFDSPQHVKERYRNPNSTKAGYTALAETSARALYGIKGQDGSDTRDLRETYSFVRPFDNEQNVPPPTRMFQRAAEEYMLQLDRIDTMIHIILTKALAKAKGIDLPDSYLNDAKGGATALFRCSRNPPVNSTDDKLVPHSDWGSVTLLYSTSPGLEELGTNGQWIEAPTGRLHVVLGDVMYMWSNGLFKPNIHRVVSSLGNEDRISFIYFCAQGVVIEKENKLLDSDGVFPVVGPNEWPLFGKISVVQHSMGYHNKYLAESKLAKEEK